MMLLNVKEIHSKNRTGYGLSWANPNYVHSIYNPTLSQTSAHLWPQSVTTFSESGNLKFVRLTILDNQSNTSLFKCTINKQSLQSGLASVTFWNIILWDKFSTDLLFNGFSETHRNNVNRVKAKHRERAVYRVSSVCACIKYQLK